MGGPLGHPRRADPCVPASVRGFAPRPGPRLGLRPVGDEEMTALTAPVRPATDAGLRPLRWRRMAWVSWRHHRIALGGVAVFLGLLAMWLWVAGLQLHHAYATAA